MQRISFAEDIIARMESGEIEALKVHAQVKKMEDILSILTDRNEKDKQKL